MLNLLWYFGLRLEHFNYNMAVLKLLPSKIGPKKYKYKHNLTKIKVNSLMHSIEKISKMREKEA